MTRPTALVTTMSAPGYVAYGRRMLKSARTHLQPDVRLILYTEDFQPEPDILPAETLLIDLHKAAPWLHGFLDWCDKDPARRGMGSGSYSMLTDARRFSFKVAAFTHAALTFRPDVLGWCDADVIFHADVDAAWLDLLFPMTCALAWLDRITLYPECGFFLTRPTLPGHRDVWTDLLALYEDRDLIGFPQTHDSYLIQHVAETLQREGRIRIASLSGEQGRRTSHPLINGPLGARLDHLKGPRKERGKSLPKDLRAPRTEPYWQGT